MPTGQSLLRGAGWGTVKSIHNFTFAGNPLDAAMRGSAVLYTVNNNLVEGRQKKEIPGKIKEAPR